MIEKISKKILNILSDENDNAEQREIMLFGITRIVEDIPKYTVIIIICILLGVIKEFGIVMLITILYKSFTGGVHMHSNIGCLIGSAISILACIYLPNIIINYENILIPFFVLVYIFSLYVIWIYVPADVPEIPVINEKRRKRDKIMSLIVLSLIYLISFLIVKDMLIITIIITTVFEIDIMTTRLMYKLFKNEYGYETYIPDELLMTD